MEVLLAKLTSLKNFLYASIFMNVLWAVLLVAFIGTANLTLLALMLISLVISYLLTVVNGIKSLSLQKYLPMNTRGYADAGTIKILGIISIILGGRIIDIVLLILVNGLIKEVRTNPVYTERNEGNQFSQQNYQNAVHSESWK